MADDRDLWGVRAPLDRKAEQLRDTVKWLIGTLGGLGAGLAIISPFTHIGQLSAARLTVAAIGVAIAIAGILWAIWSAVRVMTAKDPTLDELADASKTRAALDELTDSSKTRVEGSADELVTFFEVSNSSAMGEYPTLAELRSQLKASIEEKKDEKFGRISRDVTLILAMARYERLRSNFATALPRMMLAVVGAAVGFLLFAFAVTTTSMAATRTEGLLPRESPIPVWISLTPQGEHALAPDIGRQCGPANIPALALASHGDQVQVVTLPTKSCEVQEFIVTPDLGVLTAATPVCSTIAPASIPPRAQADPSPIQSTPSPTPTPLPVTGGFIVCTTA